VTFSVVIAWRGSTEELRRCLCSLEGQSVDQIIVSRTAETEFMAGLAEALPQVEWLAPMDALDLPELFWGALGAVSSEIVGLLESPSVAGPCWVEELLAGHVANPEVLAVGGPVRPPKSKAGWYWSEFAAYTPGRQAGVTRDLTDANVSYKRDALLAHREGLDHGHWGWRIRQGSTKKSCFVPHAWIEYTSPTPVAKALRRHVDGGRRHAVASGRSRLAGLLTTPVLPLLLVWRGWRYARAAEFGGTYLVAMPGTALFHFAWAWGEAKGYLTGK
jgi:hypothetical protein